MIRQILRQLWRQRRSNAWIWIELVVASYFLWVVIDPVYVLTADRAIPDGYSLEDVYRLNMNEYKTTHRLYNPEMSSDSARKENFMRVYEAVRQCPDVVVTSVVNYGAFPQSDSWSGQSLNHDTLEAHIQAFKYLKGTDYLGVFRIPRMDPIHTTTNESDERSIYLTQTLANKLFSNQGNPVGQYVTNSDSVPFRVAGITPDIQSRSNMQPSLLGIIPVDLTVANLPRGSQICFRVRDGLASMAFAEKFKKEMRPQLQVGNFYLESVTDFPTISRQFEYTMGTTGTYRLQSGLALFFLLCTFLGVSGTFWLRCNARREEIGIRMALGSSQKIVLRQFLTEAWLLVTAGFIVGLFIVLQQVMTEGFAQATQNGNPMYLQNQPVIHFLIVSTITYLSLLTTALVGTWIPAARAARTVPSEALHDE